MAIHEVLPLLLAAPTSGLAAWAGHGAIKMSMNPKTDKGDAAAEQGRVARETRHNLVKGR